MYQNRVQTVLLSSRDGYHILETEVTINGDEKTELIAYKDRIDNELIRQAIQAFDAAVANHPSLGKEKSE